MERWLSVARSVTRSAAFLAPYSVRPPRVALID
jgi:hypothetical protein